MAPTPEKNRRYNERHPDRVAKSKREHRERNLERVRAEDRERQRRIRKERPRRPDPVCVDCGESFGPSRSPRCPICRAKHDRNVRKARQPRYDAQRRDRMWRLVRNGRGFTIAEYEAMLEAQEGLCAICHRPERAINARSKKVRLLSVDHDHQTGEVRGLLCHSCNIAIGLFEHVTDRLTSAVDYLEETA